MKHHRAKATFYEGQAQSLRAGGDAPGGASNDPVSSLEASMRQHVERADFFAFLANHIIEDETYRLEERDLTRLEIIGRFL